MSSSAPPKATPSNSLSPEQETATLRELQRLKGVSRPEPVKIESIAKTFKLPEIDPTQPEYVYTDWRAVEQQGQLWKDAEVPARHGEAAAFLEESNDGGKWVDNFNLLSGEIPDGFIVALIGLRGTGKTQLAVSLIRKCCKRGMSARYCKAMDLFRALRACYRTDGPAEIDVVKKFARYHLLVIDEAHERSDSEWENRTLTNIIDHRYDAKRCTILISNQPKDEFAKSLGASIVSRITETGRTIVCDWPSFRKAR